MESFDYTLFSIALATLTKRKMAKFLLQLLYLRCNSRAPQICEKWIGLVCLHSRQVIHFQFPQQFFRQQESRVTKAELQQIKRRMHEAMVEGSGLPKEDVQVTAIYWLDFCFPLNISPFFFLHIYAHSLLCQKSFVCIPKVIYCGKCIVESLKCCTLLHLRIRPHAHVHTLAGQRSHSGRFWRCSTKCNW